jgi:hypothetical protein
MAKYSLPKNRGPKSTAPGSFFISTAMIPSSLSPLIWVLFVATKNIRIYKNSNEI